MAASTLAQSAISSNPDVVIGVDTHKDIHVAVALAPNGGRLGECRIPTTRKGYDELIGWTEQFGTSPLFAMEGTGSFGAGLCRELLDAGFPVVEINRPDRSTRRRLGKDDAIDAEAAARTWISGSATVIPKSGGEKVEMIRLLKCAKDSATESRTRAINQIKAILVTAPALLRERLEPLRRSALITACAALRPGPLCGPMAAAKRTLRILARRIQALEQEILELLADLDSLTQAVCPGLRQTYGVGVDGAAILLMAAGDNPQRIRSEAAFAALCGVSPLPASSGKTNRHRLNRSGNRQANATLHRIAVVRLRWHEQTQSYAARRTGEGLSKERSSAASNASLRERSSTHSWAGHRCERRQHEDEALRRPGSRQPARPLPPCGRAGWRKKSRPHQPLGIRQIDGPEGLTIYTSICNG